MFLDFEGVLHRAESGSLEGVLQLLAVDDDATLFTLSCPFLFKTERYDGLKAEAGARPTARIYSL